MFVIFWKMEFWRNSFVYIHMCLYLYVYIYIYTYTYIWSLAHVPPYGATFYSIQQLNSIRQCSARAHRRVPRALARCCTLLRLFLVESNWIPELKSSVELNWVVNSATHIEYIKYTKYWYCHTNQHKTLINLNLSLCISSAYLSFRGEGEKESVLFNYVAVAIHSSRKSSLV